MATPAPGRMWRAALRLARTVAICVAFPALTDGCLAQAEFRLRTGSTDPFSTIPFIEVPSPVLADIDDDGDQDLVVGDYFGELLYLENTAPPGMPPTFLFRPGDSNPFELIDVGDYSAPAFADLDNDGDLDAIIGESDSEDILNYYRNDGSNRSPLLRERLGAASPVDGLGLPGIPMPALADIDGDGDKDMVLGTLDGDFRYFQNTGNRLAPIFTERSGILNPFDNLFADGGYSVPALADVDRDGDLDLVSGDYLGLLWFFENTGSARVPRFTKRFGAANPFDRIAVGILSDPTLADLDGDGDVDLVLGEAEFGLLLYYENVDPGPASGFPQWQRLHFSLPAEAAIAAAGEDPDGDGRSNLMEFAFRTSPRLKGYFPVIRPTLNANGVLSFTLAVRDDPALRVTAEFSDSPAFTDPDTVIPVVSDPVPGDLVKTLTFIDLSSAAGARQRYMRLVIRLL